jgi:hypothetical protein
MLLLWNVLLSTKERDMMDDMLPLYTAMMDEIFKPQSLNADVAKGSEQVLHRGCRHLYGPLSPKEGGRGKEREAEGGRGRQREVEGGRGR